MKHYKRLHPEWLVQEGSLSGFDILEPLLEKCQNSGHVGAVLAAFFQKGGMPREMVSPELQRLSWAALQWRRSGMPIYRMEDELQDMLINTEIPNELEVLPKMPFPCIYIACDKFRVWNNQTGFHESEGVYIIQDLVKRTKESKAGEEGYLFIAVGKAKESSKTIKDPTTGKMLSGEQLRDDALAWGTVIPNANLDVIRNSTEGFDEGLRLGLNFLLLWNSTGRHLVQTTVVPTLPMGKKLKRFERQGKSASPFYLVTLRDRAEASRVKSEISNWSGPTHETLIAGFYRRHWLKDPEEAQVIGTKTNAKGTVLSCVWKYISPHVALRRGEAHKGAKTYTVKSGGAN